MPRLLTTCASCAAPLSLDAPRCVRCKTRYCNATCQEDHWRRGHKQICKKIFRGGGAEQFYADRKTAAAVKVALEACSENVPPGAFCYICLEGGDGLVRGCKCSGDQGFSHLSCLARQATIVGLGGKVDCVCPLCEGDFDTNIRCAQAWLRWQACASGELADADRIEVVLNLAFALNEAKYYEESLAAFDATFLWCRHYRPDFYPSPDCQLYFRPCIANCYHHLGRYEEALALRREVYAETVALKGSNDDSIVLKTSRDEFKRASELASTLLQMGRFAEAEALLRPIISALSDLGDENLRSDLRTQYAHSFTYSRLPGNNITVRQIVRAMELVDTSTTGDFGEILRRELEPSKWSRVLRLLLTAEFLMVVVFCLLVFGFSRPSESFLAKAVFTGAGLFAVLAMFTESVYLRSRPPTCHIIQSESDELSAFATKECADTPPKEVTKAEFGRLGLVAINCARAPA